MSEKDRGRVTSSAAEVYEEFFLPALFERWAPLVAEAAHLQPGQHVLDVACGTGVLARAARQRVGPTGTVIGLDPNEGMLNVARRKGPDIEWRQGVAEALPFEKGRFDAVLSQFGLMFFDDRRKALEEMMRVLRPGGRLAVAVWDALDHTPGYAAVTGLLEQLFGAEVADALRAPYVLGDPEELRGLFSEAWISDAEVTTHEGTARFPSIRSWMYTDVKGWTLSDKINEEGFEVLLEEAEYALNRFVTPEGTVAFSAPAHIATATKAR